jgi:predicted ABC-type ATPase
MPAPKIVMFAGPNGSGKSTITTGFQALPNFPSNYANADEIAKTLLGDRMEQSYKAARIVERQRLDWVAQRQSFAFETVMSHPSKIIQLQQAKDLGYVVEIYYVSTTDPHYNILRVADRVHAGGHNVPPQKVIERYYRSLALLPLAIEVADRVALVDNTELPIECAQAWQGDVRRSVMNCPDWVEATINAVTARKKSRETWQQWVNSNGRSMVAADSWSGSYQGEISQMDDHYLLQTVGEIFVIHDRLLLQSDYLITDGASEAIGQILAISYCEGVS